MKKNRIRRTSDAKTAPSAEQRSYLKTRPIMQEVTILILVTILCLAPFANKAFHIDDPLFLWTARYIQEHPLDPYRVEVNWDYTVKPISDITKNPPLNSYYLALVAPIVGWNETALHLAFLLPALAVIIGTYFLARKLCGEPLLAGLATLLTPVFLVSSNTVMCDTPMLALWVWAIVLWMRGLEKNEPLTLILSSFLIAICALTKYYGMSLIPLLVIYTVIKKRRVGLWMLYFLIPIAILVWYQWVTQTLYGRGLLLDAGAYATKWQSRSSVKDLLKAFVGLVFTGGCCITVLFYAHRLWSRISLIVGVIVGGILTLLISDIRWIGPLSLSAASGVRWTLVAQFGIFIVAGICIFALAITDLWKRRDAESWLLFLWIMGTFFFASFVNWVVNGRSILPMAPAVGILLMRRISDRNNSIASQKPYALIWPLIPAAVIALAVTWADYAIAGNARTTAKKICEKYTKEPGELLFQGHWGFQYYMQLLGARSFDVRSFRPNTGDHIVILENNDCPFPMPDALQFTIEETLTIPPRHSITTMRRYLGAGFYAHELGGPLPFSAGFLPHERYVILKVLGGEPDNISSGLPDATSKAIAEHTKELIENPFYMHGYYERGRIYSSKGEYDKAIVDYTQTISMNPYGAQVYTDRGEAYQKKDAHNEALLDYQQAIRINKNYARVYDCRGDLYGTKGDGEKAVADYAQASRLYFEKEEYDDAWRCVRKIEARGYQVNKDFLELLRRVSGKR